MKRHVFAGYAFAFRLKRGRFLKYLPGYEVSRPGMKILHPGRNYFVDILLLGIKFRAQFRNVLLVRRDAVVVAHTRGSEYSGSNPDRIYKGNKAILLCLMAKGCQMVYLHTKNYNLSAFLRALEW
jgi:hypothetical protein